MIMVLSCFDLVAVVTNHSEILLCLIFWLREDYDSLRKVRIYLDFVSVSFGFSSVAILVMSIERYLGAYYPIFHHTSVTRRRLLSLFPILLIPSVVMYIISINGLVVSSAVFSLILMVLYLPLFMFLNFKLFAIARKVHRERLASTGKSIDNKFEKHFYRFMGCCLSYIIIHSKHFVHCIRSCWKIYRPFKIVLRACGR